MLAYWGVKKGVKKFTIISKSLDFKGLDRKKWWPLRDLNTGPTDYEANSNDLPIFTFLSNFLLYYLINSVGY